MSPVSLAWQLAFLASSSLAAGLRRQALDGLGPNFLLLVSSPSARKVSYLEISDSAAVGAGTARPLVDSGLGGPKGLAYDASAGKLYVADPPSHRIFSFPLEARRCSDETCQLDYELVVAGPRVVVAENVLSSWVSVDSDGALYFSDQVAKSINRIDRRALERLSSGALEASSMRIVSELELNTLGAAAAAPAGQDRARARQMLEQRAQSAIIVLHEALQGPHVSTPGGLVADGAIVYWTNQARGQSQGSVAAGAAGLEAPAGVERTMAISRITDSAYGIANTHKKVFFSGKRDVYSIDKASRLGGVISQAMASPRGIAWDGDNTVYVADKDGGAIYSLACGRDGPHQPLHQIAAFPDAFGLAVIRDVSQLLTRAAAADSDAAAASPEWLSNLWPR